MGLLMSDFEPFDPDPIRRAELAIADIAAGFMVILCDDEDRENEGDLVIAAEKITPEAINFMATHARGLICLSLTSDRCSGSGCR
jgi:3,4-dihydroxy 2-butanone 4-phosphate synthase / GTP cyclohydrolase II